MTIEQEIKTYLEAQLAAFGTGDFDETDEGWWLGFGYRTLLPREKIPPELHAELTKTYADTLESYAVRIDELAVRTESDICLAWGFYTESFRQKGNPAEQYKARISATLCKNAVGRWRLLMSHRDIQRFDSNGNYLPA